MKLSDFAIDQPRVKREPWFHRHALKLVALAFVLTGICAWWIEPMVVDSMIEKAHAAETINHRQIVEEYEGQTREVCANFLGL